MMLRPLAVVLAWIATGPVMGSPPPPSSPPQDLSPTAAKLALELGVPGLAFAATDEQGIIARGVAGVRASDGADPIRFDDRFHLGSLTKAMTATVAARLVERGLIRWDSTLGSVSPDLAAEIPEHTRGLTLASLLTHRSGMPDDRNDMQLLGNLWMLQGDITDQRFRASRTMLTRIGEPDGPRPFAYANANYVVAAHMLEMVTGRPWEDLIADELFGPLGLTCAGHGPPGMDDDQGAQPKGHARTPEGLRPMPALPGTDNPPVTGPAGRVHMSIGDLAAFARAHLAGLRGRPGILTPETFAALHTPPESGGYAFGWGIRGEPGHRVSSHAGSNTRWFALMFVVPDENLAVVVAMNATPEPDGPIDALEVIREALKDAGVLPVSTGPEPDPAP